MNVGRCLSRWLGVLGWTAVLAGCGTAATVRPAGQATPWLPQQRSHPQTNHPQTTPAHRGPVAALHAAPPPPPANMTVVAGDTVYAIARRTGLSPADLITWNQLHNPGLLEPGQHLRLQPPEPLHVASVSHATGHPAAPSRHDGAESLPRAAAAVVASVQLNDGNAVQWQWPTQGKVRTRFVAGDVTRQGIEIAGKDNLPVYAAASGHVVYSGSGFVGYRELIIIKHTDHWLSAYAQNRQRLVQEGEHVAAGQRIALLGRQAELGAVLHFEIRFNGKPVDPLRYLPKP